MRFAIPSQDGVTIARHTGRAKGFIIYDTADGNLKQVGFRTSLTTNNRKAVSFQGVKQPPHENCGNRNHDHTDILNQIEDCQVMISVGMGPRLVNDLLHRGIEPVFCREESAESAARMFAQGELTSFKESQCDHQHHTCNHGNDSRPKV